MMVVCVDVCSSSAHRERPAPAAEGEPRVISRAAL